MTNIIGNWHIDYVETNTATMITFSPDGAFFQEAGRYLGRWFQNGSILTLKFDTLTLPSEPGPITLEAQIDSDFKAFSGTKPNAAYVGGLLHYNARRLTYQPPPIPASGLAKPVNQSDEDDDSPMQVRRVRR